MCPFLLLCLSHKLEQRAEEKGQDAVGARMEHVVKSTSPRGPRTRRNVLTGVWAGKKRIPPIRAGSVPVPSPRDPARLVPSRGTRWGGKGPFLGAKHSVSVSTFGGPEMRGVRCPCCARPHRPCLALRRRPASTKGWDLTSFEINSISHKGSRSQ